jgi:hypothetical protein
MDPNRAIVLFIYVLLSGKQANPVEPDKIELIYVLVCLFMFYRRAGGIIRGIKLDKKPGRCGVKVGKRVAQGRK